MTPADLEACSLLEGLDEAQLARLCESLEEWALPAGAQLFEQGDPADGLIWIAAGELRLEHARHGDCGRMGRGASLGSASLIAPGIREVSAIADRDCTLWWLSESAFKTLIDDEPQLACRVLEAIVRELASCTRVALDSLPDDACDAFRGDSTPAESSAAS